MIERLYAHSSDLYA